MILLVLSIFVFEVYSFATDKVDLHSSSLQTSIYPQLSKSWICTNMLFIF